MELIDIREPFSTASHALGLFASLPATAFLWRRSAGDRRKRLGLLIFGLGMAACYLGSAAFHAVQGDPERIDFFERLDHVGIHLLIAGTYTPLALTLLSGRWRSGTLTVVWGVTLVASTLLLLDRRLPSALATCEYLTLGWGAVFCCIELSRKLPARELGWLVFGGVLYTVGALINLTQWPTPWPGLLDHHGFFHLWVLAGNAAHFQFMLRAVIPHGAPIAAEPTAFEWPRPKLFSAAFRRRSLAAIPVDASGRNQGDAA